MQADWAAWMYSIVNSHSEVVQGVAKNNSNEKPTRRTRME
jgi:hypothetical protein